MRALLLAALFLATPVLAITSPAAENDGRRVVAVSPKLEPGAILVSLADRRLYHVRETGRAVSYPIATPRDADVWDGTQVVTAKRERPAWRPTPDMRRANPRLPPFVPGGHPYNPMGARALYLGHTYYRIHGTDAPWLVGRNVSRGCIRMLNEHVIELYEATPIGAKVTVTKASVAGPQHVFAGDSPAEPGLPPTIRRRARS